MGHAREKVYRLKFELVKYIDQKGEKRISFTKRNAVGKRHEHLTRDIRELEAGWEKATELKFEFSEYTDQTGKKLPQYFLSKRESTPAKDMII